MEKSNCHNAMTKNLVSPDGEFVVIYCTVCNLVLAENGWPETVDKNHPKYYDHTYLQKAHPKADVCGYIHYYERIVI